MIEEAQGGVAVVKVTSQDLRYATAVVNRVLGKDRTVASNLIQSGVAYEFARRRAESPSTPYQEVVSELIQLLLTNKPIVVTFVRALDKKVTK